MSGPSSVFLYILRHCAMNHAHTAHTPARSFLAFVSGRAPRQHAVSHSALRGGGHGEGAWTSTIGGTWGNCGRTLYNEGMITTGCRAVSAREASKHKFLRSESYQFPQEINGPRKKSGRTGRMRWLHPHLPLTFVRHATSWLKSFSPISTFVLSSRK